MKKILGKFPPRRPPKASKSSARKHHMPRRLIFIIILVIIFFSLIALFGQNSKFPAPISEIQLETLVQESIHKTFNSDYYTFTNRSTLTVEDKERIFSVLEGEKALQNSHISGSILGSAVNIYQLDKWFYQKDPLDGSWHKTENISTESAAHLISELHPESNFCFLSINNLSNLGTEKIQGYKTIKIKFTPTLKDTWIDKYFDNITYTLWINKKHQYIIRSKISAQSKENHGALLVIENSFDNFGKKIRLQIPAEIAHKATD
ncbi:MAG: hypothetical protein ACOX05_02100 [Bacillota bacterium]